jgi:heme exporter protein D
MIDLGPHAIFIVSAYLGVAAAIAALIAYTLVDARRTAKRLAALEAQGIRRRSAGAKA